MSRKPVILVALLLAAFAINLDTTIVNVALATLGKVVGWLAHAMEEYGDPSRFRARGYYIGPRPGA